MRLLVRQLLLDALERRQVVGKQHHGRHTLIGHGFWSDGGVTELQTIRAFNAVLKHRDLAREGFVEARLHSPHDLGRKHVLDQPPLEFTGAAPQPARLLLVDI